MTMLGAVTAAGWLATGAGALAVTRMLLDEARPGRVLCLSYHRIADTEAYETYRGTERRFAIPDERFRAHLDWLVEAGYRFVTLDQVVDHVLGLAELPERCVHLSFDDGCVSVHARALPLLRARGIPATVFVTEDEGAWVFHDGPHAERRMTDDELRECDAAGITVESHGVSHRGLVGMTASDALAELTGSRERLTLVTGRRVRYLSIPLNFYDGRALDLCRRAGYRAVCVSDAGANHVGDDPYRLRRLVVEGGASAEDLARALGPLGMVERRAVGALKRLPPRLLGERVWMPLRRRLYASPLGPLLGAVSFGRLVAVGAAGAIALLLAVTVARRGHSEAQ